MILKRLADVSIETYSMVVGLSRVTRALKLNLSSAEVEMNMCDVHCNEALDLINVNLNGIEATDKLNNYKLMKLIAEKMMSNRGVVPNDPCKIKFLIFIKKSKNYVFYIILVKVIFQRD